MSHRDPRPSALPGDLFVVGEFGSLLWNARRFTAPIHVKSGNVLLVISNDLDEARLFVLSPAGFGYVWMTAEIELFASALDAIT